MKQSIEKKKPGRPVKYSSTILNELFELLADGKTIRECVKELNVTWPTLRKLINQSGNYEKYLQSKNDSVLLNLDSLDVLLEEARSDPKLNMTKVKLLEIIQKNVHFKASKLAPKIFGSEKQMMSIQDAKGNEFKVEWQK